MNKAILMGRLTRDPELSTTSGTGATLCKFSIAVDRQFVRQGEERKADYFNIVTWNKTAEFCKKYFVKGMRVLVVGRIENRQWDDQQGIKRYATDIIAEEVHFADSKRSDGYGNAPSAYNQQSPYSNVPAQSSAGGQGYQANNYPSNQPAAAKPADSDGFYPLDEDDDMPF